MLILPKPSANRPDTNMKDLLDKMTKQVSASKSAKQRVARKNDVQAFLKQVAKLPKTPNATGKEARLIFSLDATASRQIAWDQATQLQGEMFVSAQSQGGLQVQLCYFRGLGEFYSSPWHTDSDKLLKQMSGIYCQAGMTQLQRLLKHVIDENNDEKIRGVIFIGDAMEESMDVLCQIAGKLGLLNVPLFLFQEREDPVARRTFVEMARLSGGAYCQFDSSSAQQLKDLLRAVAIYATGGLKALEDFSKTSHQSVKLLGQQLK